MKKGFTLIELLAVIVLLGIVTVVAYPTISDVISSSKESAHEKTISSLENIAYLYSLDNNLTQDEDEQPLLFSTIVASGHMTSLPTDPATSQSLPGCIMYSWRGNQYKFRYDETCNAKVSEEILMDISFTSKGTSTNGWYKNNFYVSIEVSGNSYYWCTGTSTCEPDSFINSNKGSVYITTESDSNIICVIGYNYEDHSIPKCSNVVELYKLDKTAPVINGISNSTVLIGSSVNLTTGISVNDSLSGINGTYSYNPTIVDTTTAGIKTITYSVSDNAGNTTSVNKEVTVQTAKPTIAFTTIGTFNGNGWAKADFFAKATATADVSSSISSIVWCSGTSACTPITSVSSNNVSALISNNSATNVMCAKAIDATGNSSDVICSSNYKLDKVAPTAGTINLAGTLGTNSWYTTNVNVSSNNGTDALSGHSSTITDITSITSNTTGTLVTLTTTDLAGNTATTNTTVKVDKNSPTITANSGTVSIFQGASNVVSGYFTVGYSISSGSVVCTPVNTSTLAIGTPTLSCTATGGNGLTAVATKQITVTCGYTVNQQFTFDYTGAVQTFVGQCAGSYKLEVWGAQGGNGEKGGYSIGHKILTSGTSLYVYVGGNTTNATGGFNGGGSSTNSNLPGYGGGGATHIATITGLLPTLSSSQSSVLIVAGGGGGVGGACTGYCEYSGSTGASGAAGGINGLSGGNSYNSYGNYAYPGTGGTSNLGGTGGTYSINCGGNGGGSSGGFGYGGTGGSGSTSSSGCSYGGAGGGGGGGWYGGGGGSGGGTNGCNSINVSGAGGGGGSGYIGGVSSNATYSITKAMYCYNCTTSAAAETLTYTTTNSSATATANYAKLGNGYARITYLGN